MNNFINLHTNTEYSFLESTIRLDELIQFAIDNNQKYLAVTEHNSLFSFAPFINKCYEKKINPIVGIDLDVQEYRIIIIPKNKNGFIFINKLSFEISNNQTITFEQLDSDDVFYLDHPQFGFFKLNNSIPNIKFQDLFFYNSTNMKDSHAIVLKENITLSQNDNDLLKVIRDIKNSQDVHLGNDFTFTTDYESTIVDRTNLIAKQCVFEKQKYIFKLPKFKNKNNMPSFDYLKTIATNQLVKRKNEFENFEIAKERLFTELSVINNLGFSDYFLIIWDLVSWSYKQNIEIGPGRGSAAGSLVAFLLNITKVNPLDYGLLFERFLNKSRVTMPDIDIDIQDNRRNEILDYLEEKYGKDHFSLITTYQTLGTKSSIRDVARTLNIPIGEVNAITKKIKLNDNLEKTRKQSAIINTINGTSHPELWKKVFDLAIRLENRPRQVSTHAAGIVLSSDILINTVPIWNNNSINSFSQTQLSMEHLENFGLLKIDLLGLKNLKIINDVETTLSKLGIKNNFDIKKNDAKTFSILNNGLTLGIFQLESIGMTKTIQKVNISKFSDIYDIISLYRPGPMKNIPTYIDNKNYQVASTINPVYDEILSETYGVIVYQEQIMQICQKVANMSLSEADLFRRAIGKKNLKQMQAERDSFINGAISNNYTPQIAKNIFNQIEQFASYGFNKSHAVSYAFIAYKMAYYKAHYSLIFYGSLLESFISSQDKVASYIQEIKAQNIKINSPTIEHIKDFVLIKNNQLTLPLRYINGLGSAAIDSIQNTSQISNWLDSFSDFISACHKSNIGYSVILKLIESNTLRKFGNVATLLKILKNIKDDYEGKPSKKDMGEDKKMQFNIFEKTIPLIEKVEEDYEKFVKYQESYFKSVFDDEMQREQFKYENSVYCDAFTPGVKFRIIIQILDIKNINRSSNKLELISFFDGRQKYTFWVNEQKPFFGKLEKNKYYEVEMMLSRQNNYNAYAILGER